MLRDRERAVRGHLDDRVPGGLQIDAAPVEQRVPASGLGSTFVDVPGDDAGRDPVPVVRRPAMLVDQRSIGERRVGRSTGDHDVRLHAQRLDDRGRSDIGVRALDPVPHGRQRLAGLHVPQLVTVLEQRVEPVHQVVPGNDRHPQWPRGRNLLEGLEQSAPTSIRIHTAGVAHHPDSTTQQFRTQPCDQRYEITCVPCRGIPLALFLQDRHRDLGQIVEHQVVDRTGANLQLRGFLPVAPESLPRGHTHNAFAHRIILILRKPASRLTRRLSG